MVTKIQKWGNSQGLRLPKQILTEAQLMVGDDVDVSTSDGLIIITAAKPVRVRRSLQDLISKIPKGYRPTETDWGTPVGNEVW
ncbi:MAG: AbrB/MazE/SpoVT family DNA-binding domain-containing protein [Ignavibacteria bacterium]|nr:AbrB/MazE/SpoVT family DNA-binding domain-containing protein [Ignavibacteria bacterium]